MEFQKFMILIVLICFIPYLNAQKTIGDSIYFKLDNKQIFQSKYVTDSYVFKYELKEGMFYFKKKKEIFDLIPPKTTCLNRFLRKQKLLGSKKTINGDGLVQLLESKTVFLVVDKEKKIFEVVPVFAID